MQDIDMLTGEQVRAALAMLKMRQETLAERASLSVPTVQRIAAADGIVPGRLPTVMAVKRVLEAEGIDFIDGPYTGDGGPGVRLRRK